MMKLNYKHYLFLALLILAAAYIYFTISNASPIRDSIIKEINSCQHNEELCLIGIQGHTAFEWDKMFFFQDNINFEALGISDLESDVEPRFHECFREFSNILLFVKNEEIVYCEYEDLKWDGVDPYAKLSVDSALHGVGPLTTFKASERNSRYYLEVYE